MLNLVSLIIYMFKYMYLYSAAYYNKNVLYKKMALLYFEFISQI